jgi:hypothetical protein
MGPAARLPHGRSGLRQGALKSRQANGSWPAAPPQTVTPVATIGFAFSLGDGNFSPMVGAEPSRVVSGGERWPKAGPLEGNAAGSQISLAPGRGLPKSSCERHRFKVHPMLSPCQARHVFSSNADRRHCREIRKRQRVNFRPGVNFDENMVRNQLSCPAKPL